MAGKSIFSYELIDNKIPCGGFNLLGGGVKGRNIESKESQSLVLSLFFNDTTDWNTLPQRLLVLNYEDYVKINPILQNPPSDTKVVASNLRFTCLNYYDCLQILSKIKEDMDNDELASWFKKATNGNIVTLYDIANLYTKELGIKVVPWEDMPLDAVVQNILIIYYNFSKISFEDWIKKSTIWTADLITPKSYGIDQTVSKDSLFKNFMLDFTTEGNTLTYVKPQN